MAGSTRDEMTFAMQPLGMLETLEESWASAALSAFGVDRSIFDDYRAASRPGADDAAALAAAWTDWAFRIPTIRLLEAHRGRSFAYEFCWQSPVPRLGAIHALECPFVNDNLAAAKAALRQPIAVLGDEPPQSLASDMHKAWVSFASSGDPGWAAYEPERRVTMRFDIESGPVDDLAGAERRLWDGLR
jgi:para-nitrobenzyl esterase